MYLYEKMTVRREDKNITSVPEYVEKNLHFKPRDYQSAAFENFITHFESDACPHPTQVLFHMATGSGKTLIMAGLIIYLYRRGYRNFLFFVNLKNIVDKTRDNFLNGASKKYLFAEEIVIDGRRVRVNAVENFQHADADAINICFTTTQGLHMAIEMTRENSMTLADFDELKVVFISDEAHHLNAETKKKPSAAEKEQRETWENTIKHLFRRNRENILLEFTATCDTDNASIKAKYEDKIVFDYALKKFYDDGYSKEIMTLRTSERADRILTALVLSQYRLKVFGDNQLNVKPVVLFKSLKVQESKDFMAEFIRRVENLRGERLRELAENCDGILRRAFEYFSGKGITFDALAAELREGFCAANCISANDETDSTANQNALNALEVNNYRAVFEVKKLDEGWDVLNLFDIVRLYETRTPSNTLSEAQLIGRGARYFPFEFDDKPEDKRKFDRDADRDLRVCETLYYHCENDRRYIDDLHRALHEMGLTADRKTFEYKLKESFTGEELYKHGIIYVNERTEIPREFDEVIPEKIYRFERIAAGGSDKVMTAEVESVNRKVEMHTVRRTFAEIAAVNYAIVHKALRKFPAYNFDALKKLFPNLQSTSEFITGEKYLGNITIDITSGEREPDVKTLHAAAVHVLKIIAEELAKPAATYRGTTEFFARDVSKVFKKKVISLKETHAGGHGTSQNLSGFDLSAAEWFAYEDNFGTSEEKNFIEYFARRVEELRKIYDKVFLVRNERAFAIYSFEDGRRFEPDFVLFLQKKGSDELDFLQIFIEPKGEHLAANDAWKENFLRELEGKAIPAEKIFGLPFFNGDKEQDFDSAFRTTLKL